jgi:poly(3-hydroxybutyrate) depolymerase
MDLSYFWYEAAHWMLTPARAAADATQLVFKNPVNPITYTPYGRPSTCPAPSSRAW